MEKGLLEKTGKPLDHWIVVVKKSKIKKHKAITDFLKSEHGFTYGYANFVSLKARESDAASFTESDLLTLQYKGKESLKPIYEALIEMASNLGKDVTITPKKSAVSFIRKKQFLLIKPATKTRIDLGLKLKDVNETSRLESSGPFGSMCSNRVQLTSVEQVDAELLGWIQLAYDQSV